MNLTISAHAFGRYFFASHFFLHFIHKYLFITDINLFWLLESYMVDFDTTKLIKLLAIWAIYKWKFLFKHWHFIEQITGMHHWKHAKKGSGVFWLQQAQDDVRLNRIALQLFEFVGKSVSDDSFKVNFLMRKSINLNAFSLIWTEDISGGKRFGCIYETFGWVDNVLYSFYLDSNGKN